MAKIHATLVGDDLHEVKGADTATDGQVYKANGNGTATFVDPTSLENVRYVNRAYNELTTPLDLEVGQVTQIPFDADVTNTDFSILSTGQIKFDTSGLYILQFIANVAAKTNDDPTEDPVIFQFRSLVNGVQYGPTHVELKNLQGDSGQVRFDITGSFTANDILTFEATLHADGPDDGHLFSVSEASVGWTPPPVASFTMLRVSGGA